MKKIVILCCILLLSGCKRMAPSNALVEENIYTKTIDSITGTSYITTYTIYGRYFNISGFLDSNPSNLSLIIKSEVKEEECPLITEYNDSKTYFKTNELINEGINLEHLEEGEYLLLLKENKEDSVNYYTLENNTNYKDLEYYTITKNSENRKIDIKFTKYNRFPFLTLISKKSKLDDSVYDIVIDAGHGGVDVGAHKNGQYESHMNLDYAKRIYEKLTNLGLKVKLTRESDESIPNYGVNGRVSIPYQTRAKLMLSIHMNSAVYNVLNGGVEIYVANHANTTFASHLAKNVVDLTSSSYSKNKAHKVLSGVYLRTLSKKDIEDIEKSASKGGYLPYEGATEDSTYYYIIRETGGIVTGAYVDSRNKKKEWNRYYLSNYGTESYLVELGYINSQSNLRILLEEKDKYVEAIVKSVKEYLEI